MKFESATPILFVRDVARAAARRAPIGCDYFYEKSLALAAPIVPCMGRPDGLVATYSDVPL